MDLFGKKYGYLLPVSFYLFYFILFFEIFLLEATCLIGKFRKYYVPQYCYVC